MRKKEGFLGLLKSTTEEFQKVTSSDTDEFSAMGLPVKFQG